ncbi:hypothetical protein D3C74_266640 [compost metagenome]
MAFNRRTITKELDIANLQKHNDNYADIKTELDAHDTHVAAQTAHGSTADATPGKIMQRDEAGRAKVAAPAAADDVARKAEVDAVQGNLSIHMDDILAHLSPEDRAKFESIEEGAEVNQFAFATIGTILATSPTDTITFESGTGIAITYNPTLKKITWTATGDATPGPHGPSHDPDGSDPIPALSALIDAFNALTAADIGAETPAGAQAKVDALAGVGNMKTVKQIDDEVTAHLADLSSQAAGKGASIVGVSDIDGLFTSEDVEGALKEAMNKANSAFQSASDGKMQIAAAITGKGVSASGSDTFSQLATKIGQISTGKKVASGTGTTAADSGLCTVTGLDFLPKYIFVEVDVNGNGSYIARATYYDEGSGNLNTGMMAYSGGTRSAGSLVTNFSINSTGFSVAPIYAFNKPFKYYCTE